MKKPPNHRDIAQAAGVSSAAVSLALRNHPSIPESTRERIRKTAEELGYIPNPRVAELMGRIRRNRAVDSLQETVAMIWADIQDKAGPQAQIIQQFEEGARPALLRNGFGLEIFHQKPGLPLERIERILRTRGIRGLILAPLLLTPQMRVDWNWSHLTVVVAGSADWHPEFNRVSFNHFAEMKLLVRQLEKQGKHRIGFVVNQSLDQRSQHAVVGGFWASVSKEIRSEEAVLEHKPQGKKAFLNWMKSYQPDCLIVGSPSALTWMQEMASPPPFVVRSLRGSSQGDHPPGIRQNYHRLGEVAAEMLVSQLQINQFGIPADPVQSLITGKWENAEEGHLLQPYGT